MKGHVRRRGNGWVFVHDNGRDAAGKRRQFWSRAFRTQGEAEAGLAKKLTQLNEGGYVEPTKVTLGEYLDEWLAAQAHLKETARKNYGDAIRNYVTPHIGGTRLANVSGPQIKRLLADLQVNGRIKGSGGLSSTSVRNVHAILRKALRDAVADGLIGRNPIDSVKAPPRAEIELKTWDADEARRFLRATAGDRLHALFVLALTTGMRRGEILGLRWSDVDLAAGRLSVRQNLVSIGYRLVFTTPKTKASRRSI